MDERDPEATMLAVAAMVAVVFVLGVLAGFAAGRLL